MRIIDAQTNQSFRDVGIELSLKELSELVQILREVQTNRAVSAHVGGRLTILIEPV